ncbi:molybdopterin-dependent oxidoreductase [Sphingobium lactosutens]|uniref:molybdopterin-dependent oxidoreductase n=1 Tax=Sphingobium lactosutens TaxID=522773 RepID=UPI0015BECAAE
METRTRLCPFCEACCGLVVSYEPDTRRIMSIKGDKDNPFSQGYLCPKSQALKLLEDDPDRLTRPLVREKGGFVETDYDTAIDRAAFGIRRVIEQHGTDAMSLLVGNPSSHNLGMVYYLPLYLRAVPSRNVGTAGSVDHIAKCVAAVEMFGCEASIPVPDIDRTQHIIIIGANPVVSNGSLVCAPGWPRRLEALKQRGGRIVVIDPRRSETSDIADEHMFIRPGADAYLLLAMVHVLFADGLVRMGRLEAMVDGLDRMAALSADFAPDRVARVTGIAAEDIRRLAIEFAHAPQAVVYGRIGTSAQRFGTLTSWLVDVLNILTGNLDRPGGAMFPKSVTQSVIYNQVAQDGIAPHNRWRSRVNGAPEVSGFLPMAVFPDEILTPGEGQIRGLLTLCTNAVRSVPDSNRFEEAFSSLDHMVSLDIYLNETTRFADVILPPCSHLEQIHYPPFHPPYMVRSYAQWDDALFDGEAPNDGEMLLKLVSRITGKSEAELERQAIVDMATAILSGDPELQSLSPAAVVDSLMDGQGPEKFADLLIRAGPFGDRFGARPEGLTLAQLKTYPHGVDFGPMVEQLPSFLRTADKRIRLTPEVIVKDLDRLASELPELEKENRLLLVGRRHLRSNNSWMHNVPALGKGPDRTRLMIHPDDAKAHGLDQDGVAKVSTASGEIAVQIEPSDRMMRGVVSLAHGFGHDETEARMDYARQRPGANYNALLDGAEMDAVSGAAVLSGIPVMIEPFSSR